MKLYANGAPKVDAVESRRFLCVDSLGYELTAEDWRCYRWLEVTDHTDGLYRRVFVRAGERDRRRRNGQTS